jgi:hypothetical protein
MSWHRQTQRTRITKRASRQHAEVLTLVPHDKVVSEVFMKWNNNKT